MTLRVLTDYELSPLGKVMRWYCKAVGDLVMRPEGMSDAEWRRRAMYRMRKATAAEKEWA